MALITYDQYAALKSKVIWRTITDKETKQLREFEAAQPKTCPDCGANTVSAFTPPAIAHDPKNCPRKTKPKE